MNQTGLYQGGDVRVVKAVIDQLAGTSKLDQSEIAQDTQMLRHSRLADADERGQVAGA